MKETTLGERITFYRKKSQMLQKDLAEKAGVSPTALNYYERDKREPNVLTLKNLAVALGITGDELLGISGLYPVSTHVERINILCNELNDNGQAKVEEYAQDLVDSGKYKKRAHDAKNGEKTEPA